MQEKYHISINAERSKRNDGELMIMACVSLDFVALYKSCFIIIIIIIIITVVVVVDDEYSK